MSSTILYKFRSGTTFEALSLPGSAARLFDVKKAIVTAKKLDQGSMEFDLAVKDATTNEDYTDESMLLPRGTRVVVQRLPAAKGQGFLARMARAQMTGSTGMAPASTASSAPENFYTIDGRAQEDDEEFVSTNAEDKELAALRAATEAAGNAAMPVMATARPGMRPAVAGSGPPPTMKYQNQAAALNSRQIQRPNADPELREQEKQLLPKKRATGIPRTFLNLSAPPNTDGSGDGDGSVPLLQPNITGFKELINRGGGLSELAIGTKKDLDYALKLTSTTIPEYLLCAICHSVVRDAMMLPWDPEGRTTCDFCIRDALSTGGFRCPLTGQEGVSPDDLLPNHALRKAAQSFINEVMAKIEEIEEEPEDEDLGVEQTNGAKTGQGLDGDAVEQGVLVSRKTTVVKKQNQDPFADDELAFGGDVFAVAQNELKASESEPITSTVESSKVAPDKLTAELQKQDINKEKSDKKPEILEVNNEAQVEKSPQLTHQRSPSESKPEDQSRRENTGRRRAPPMGYQMGPAVSSSGTRTRIDGGEHQSPIAGRVHGGRFADRSFNGGRFDRGGRFGGRGRYGDYPPQHVSANCFLRDFVAEILSRC